jgi:hypothetical protein
MDNNRPGCTIGIGNIIAMIISWHLNHSILWMLLHGLFGWLYVIYYLMMHWK